MTNELDGTTASQADDEKNPVSPKIKPWYSWLPGDTSSKFARK